MTKPWVRVSETLNALKLFAYSTCVQAATLQAVTPLRRRRNELVVSWGLSEGQHLQCSGTVSLDQLIEQTTSAMYASSIT